MRHLGRGRGLRAEALEEHLLVMAVVLDVDRASGTLTWLTPADDERRRPVTRVSFQVLRVSGSEESAAGEYALAHEPWTGPGSPR